MAESIQYVSVNTILAKFHRDLKKEDVNESDVIEYIGEALGFLKVPQIQEQAIAFIEVKDYECKMPEHLQMVLQIARNNDWSPETKEKCLPPVDVVAELIRDANLVPDTECEDCDESFEDVFGNNCIDEYSLGYIPYFDMQAQYIPWTSTNHYKETYTPVRLANHTFFNTLVCKEKDESPYENENKDIATIFSRHDHTSEQDEYNIIGTEEKKLQFSFREGYIAVAYVRNAMDNETGYPLIPDNIRHITAITYYIKWKLAEMYMWNGRAGFDTIAADNERKWLKYVRQANNYMKMPKSIDEFQNLLESSHYLIPRHRRYYGFFGKLGREENRSFNDPDYTRRLNYYSSYYGR